MDFRQEGEGRHIWESWEQLGERGNAEAKNNQKTWRPQLGLADVKGDKNVINEQDAVKRRLGLFDRTGS